VSEVTYFETATVYAGKINIMPRLVRLTGGHRGQMAKLDLGYLIVEKKWYPSSESFR
jgi:hypothetical protein